METQTSEASRPRGAQQVADAVFHHARGFVGERDGENGAARDALFDQMGDAIGDDARLAGAGAGENEQRAFGREHGFALAFVEFVEESGWREGNCSSANSN